MLQEWSESLAFILSNMHETVISHSLFFVSCSVSSDFQSVVSSVLDDYVSQIIDTPNQISLR